MKSTMRLIVLGWLTVSLTGASCRAVEVAMPKLIEKEGSPAFLVHGESIRRLQDAQGRGEDRQIKDC